MWNITLPAGMRAKYSQYSSYYFNYSHHTWAVRPDEYSDNWKATKRFLQHCVPYK